jgi:hypothetical protein
VRPAHKVVMQMTGTQWMYSHYTKFVYCVRHVVFSLERDVKISVSVLLVRCKIGE